MKVLTLTDSDYPSRLKALKKPPEALFVKGEMPEENTPLVGIVGTRSASERGKEIAYDMAQKLSKEGIWVISGLARGIDTAAHQGAKGKTIAVLGSGFNKLYPKENEKLSQEITLFSEYAPDIPPARGQFPQRNRIVAALSDILIVVEAPEKSGALITAELAIHLDKKCFVIPGPFEKAHFRGSNRLIKEGKGEICLDVEEIFSFFKKEQPVINSKFTHSKTAHPEEFKILSLLEREDLSFDQLMLLTGYSASHLNVHLMSLVLNRLIKEYAGRVYGKIAYNS